MKKEFIVNIALLLAINFLVKPFYLFFVEKNIQLELNRTEFGVYLALFNLTLILQVLNDFGLQNYITRHLSQRESQDKSDLAHFFGVKILFALLYFSATILIAFFIFGYTVNLKLILHLSFNQILISAIAFFRACLAGSGYYRLDSRLSSLDRLLLIVFGMSFLHLPSLNQLLTVEVFVWMQTGSLLITALISLAFVFKKLDIKGTLLFRQTEVRAIIYACWPFALLFLFNAMYAKQDMILLSKFSADGAKTADLYAFAMRIFDASSMLSLAFGSLCLGMFSRLRSKQDQLQKLFWFSYKLLMFLSLSMIIFIAFYSAEINLIINKQDHAVLNQSLSVLCIAFVFAAPTYLYGALFQAELKEKQLVMIYLVCAVFNLIANLIFIPSYGMLASAIINLMTQIICLGMQVLLSGKQYFSSAFGLRLILLFSVLSFSAYGLHLYCSSLILSLLIWSVLIAILGILFKWISLQEVKEIISEKLY